MSSTNISDLLKDIQVIDPNYTPRMNFALLQHNRTEHIKHVDTIEITNMDKVDTQFALTPILPAPGLMMIFASAGVGKTYFALNMACAMASGGQFLKYASPLPRKVLYVDAEMSFPNIQKRLIDLHAEHCIEKGQLGIITPDLIKAPYRIPSIDTLEDQQFYEHYLMENNFDVVVFDNLSTLTSMEENISTDWKRIQDWLIYLRSQGKTVILIHHSGKDKSSYRGTSRMLDVMNTVILLQREPNVIPHPLYGFPAFTVHYQKNRDFGGKDVKPFHVYRYNNQWDWQNKDMTDVEQIVSLKNEGMTQSQIAKELNINQSTVSRIIKRNHI